MHVAMHIATQKTQKETNVHGILCHHFSIVKFLWIAFERKNRGRAYKLFLDLILDLSMFHILLLRYFIIMRLDVASKLLVFICGTKLSTNTISIYNTLGSLVNVLIRLYPSQVRSKAVVWPIGTTRSRPFNLFLIMKDLSSSQLKP